MSTGKVLKSGEVTESPLQIEPILFVCFSLCYMVLPGDSWESWPSTQGHGKGPQGSKACSLTPLSSTGSARDPLSEAWMKGSRLLEPYGGSYLNFPGGSAYLTPPFPRALPQQEPGEGITKRPFFGYSTIHFILKIQTSSTLSSCNNNNNKKKQANKTIKKPKPSYLVGRVDI